MVLALWALLSTYFADIERLDDMMDGKIYLLPSFASCLTDEDTEVQRRKSFTLGHTASAMAELDGGLGLLALDL